MEEVIVRENMEKRLLSGGKLRIKLGIDPTGSVLHLGHAVVLRKLKDFQALGHQVIFLIGDYTARIGDPTGRSETRKPMTEKEIKENMKSYTKQAGLILDMKKVEVRYNSEWFNKMNVKDMIFLTSKITFAQMSKRADFKERISKDVDLSMQEFLYPALQGYDSVALKADVEIGGTDQKFNLLMGRQLQERYGQKPQDIITCPLLEGLSGGDKMSKSKNNYIALTEAPSDMFGKVMSLSDNMITRYFELAVGYSKEEIKKIEKEISNGANPRDIKIRLAKELIKFYHSEKEAQKAEEYFVKTFSKRELPTDIPEVKSKKGELLSDILVANKIIVSKSEFRRLVEGRAIDVDEKELADMFYRVEASATVKVGKKKFVKIIVK